MGFFNNLGRMIENFEEGQIIRQEQQFMFQQDMILAEEEWLMEGQMFDPYQHGQMFFDPVLGHHGVMYNGLWHPLDFVNGAWMFAHPSRFGVPRNYQPQNLLPPQAAGYGGGYPPQPPMQGYSQGPAQGYPQQQPPMQSYPQQPPVQNYSPGPVQGYPQQQPPTQSYPQQQPPAQGTYPQQSRAGYQPAPAAPQAAGVTCSRCHAVNPAGGRFCSSCGNDLNAAPPAPSASVAAFCTGCGAAMADGARFCASCGRPRS
jgi:hypothetical protein